MARLRGAEIDTGAKDSEVLQHPLFAIGKLGSSLIGRDIYPNDS